MAGSHDSAQALAALRIPVHAVPPLLAYLRRLDAWAARINLTGARPGAERVELLVAGVLALAPHLLAGPVLDIGALHPVRHDSLIPKSAAIVLSS